MAMNLSDGGGDGKDPKVAKPPAVPAPEKKETAVERLRKRRTRTTT